MHQVWICGAGKIGTSIAHMLAQSGDYDIDITDLHFEGDDIKRLIATYPNVKTVVLDLVDKAAVKKFLEAKPKQAVVSCLPYAVNVCVAEYAKAFNLHYFDLTEDIQVTEQVKQIASGAKTAFVPQCGLAPGYIGLAANELLQKFEKIEQVELRVGALPQQNNNALHYALTWSTEGIINEYGNLCESLIDYKKVSIQPLEGLERLIIKGSEYEAFNTSGGLGSLMTLYENKVKEMNYKTIRYPGHCLKMRVLMNDLKMNEDRDTLKTILERAIPKTYQDVVITFVSVNGLVDGVYLEETLTRNIYPRTIGDLHWSAIQVATTAGVCAVLDLLLENANNYQGFVYQEQFSYQRFIENRFGQYYS